MSSIPQPTFQQQSNLLQQGWGFVQQPHNLSNQRFALCRVWRGYIMTAYRSNGSDNQIYFQFCDPYQPAGNNWTPKQPPAPSLITQSSVAACYLNSVVYVFFGQTSNNAEPTTFLAYSYASQPSPVNVANNQYWDFTNLQFSATPEIINSSSALTLGPSAALFGGFIWILYGIPASSGGSSSNLCLIAAPAPSLQAGTQLNFDVVGAITDQTSNLIVTNCEPVLLSFQDALYCFFVNTSNTIQYVRVDQPGSIMTVGNPAMITDAAPGVVTDPTGTLVILAYKTQGGTNSDIMYSWSADLNSWAPPLNTNQQTSTAPTLYASNTGQILMAYRSGSDGGGDARLFTTNPSTFWFLPNGVNITPPSD